MNIAVFTPDLVSGDAVGNDVREMTAVLRRAGYHARPAACRGDMSPPTLYHTQLADYLQSPEDLLIYHHSIGSMEGLEVYRELRCRKIIKYHNVTPPEFYQPINPHIASICRYGLEQIPELLKPNPVVWVDSEFNGRDLQAIQPDLAFEVLPPFNQLPPLLECEPDALGIAEYDDWRTNILVVGRIVPNKDVIRAVEAFAEYRQRYSRHARLIVIGKPHARYCRRVIDLICELNLEKDVVLTNKVTLEQLKAFYLTADMLLTTSRHEGFCLPLVEAMALQVPMVAVPSTAIPGTAGDAAWYTPEDPAGIAEVMNQVLNSDTEREAKLVCGRQRYETLFRNESIAGRLLELMNVFQNVEPSSAVRI